MQEDDVPGSSHRAWSLFGLEQCGQAQPGDAGSSSLEQAPARDLASHPIIKATGYHVSTPQLNAEARILCC
jgi:hypothetical protein